MKRDFYLNGTPFSTYSPLMPVLQPYANCKDNHFCMILTSAELEALPTVTIHMDGGLEVHVRPSGYMDALGKDNAYAPR